VPESRLRGSVRVMTTVTRSGSPPGCPSEALAATGRDAPGGAPLPPESAEVRGPITRIL